MNKSNSSMKNLVTTCNNQKCKTNKAKGIEIPIYCEYCGPKGNNLYCSERCMRQDWHTRH